MIEQGKYSIYIYNYFFKYQISEND